MTINYIDKQAIDDYCEKKEVSAWLNNAIYGIDQKFPGNDITISLHTDSENNEIQLNVEYDIFLNQDLDQEMFDYIESVEYYCFNEMIHCKTDGWVNIIPHLKRMKNQR